MRLTPVESSHIAAIGYLEDERVLLVRYKDGGLYGYAGVSSGDWDKISASDNPGKLLKDATRPQDYVLISKGPNHNWTRPTPAQTAPPVDAGALNVIDGDASKCCRRDLAFHEAHGINQQAGMECSECGTNFRPEMVAGICHWRIVPLFALHRNR